MGFCEPADCWASPFVSVTPVNTLSVCLSTADQAVCDFNNADQSLRGGRVVACDALGVCLTREGLKNPPCPLLGVRVPHDSYLVDPASSHMLVSKIKPCMSKYKQLYTVKLQMAH